MSKEEAHKDPINNIEWLKLITVHSTGGEVKEAIALTQMTFYINSAIP